MRGIEASASREPSPRPAQSSPEVPTEFRTLRKFSISVPPGRTEYRITHNLQSEDVIVQTRIAGRIREGGISVLDANNVQLTFGGVLNEQIDVVIIG